MERSSKSPNQGGMAIAQKGNYTSFPEIAPISLDSFYYSAAVRMAENKLYTPALQYAQKAYSLDSLSYNKKQTLNALYYFTNQNYKALSGWKEILKENYPVEIKSLVSGEIGKVYNNMGVLDSAVRYYHCAIEYNEENALAVSNLSFLLLEQNLKKQVNDYP